MECFYQCNAIRKWLSAGVILILLACPGMARPFKSTLTGPVHLFTIDKAQEISWRSLRSNKEVRIFTYDQSFYEQVKTEKPALLNLIIPTIQGEIEVNLIENQVLKEDFVLSSDKQKNIPYTPGRFYKGKVHGNDSSFVAISLFDDEVFGLISMPGQSNLVIGSTPALRRNTFMLFQDADVAAPPFSCGTDELPQWATKIEQHNGGFRSTTFAASCVNVYFEVGNNVFTSKGSESAAANFISGIFNATVSLYSAESITTSISAIKVWTSPEPYSSTASTALTDFGTELKGGFNGNIAHFVRLNTGSYSGVAWVDALCSTVPFAYSEVASSYTAYPAYSWNVNVITHEMGHNLGSPHTHACSWPGGPIDNCYTPEGNCSPGPTPPKNGGTIMSYCHLVSSVGISFTNGFGPLPGAKIRSSVSSATCLGACGSSSGGGGGGSSTTAPDLQIASVTLTPSTLTSLAQSTNIAFVTTNVSGTAAASSSRIYFSSDNSVSSEDVTVADVAIPSITATSSISSSLSYALPGTTTPGTYYIIVCADATSAVTESSETNNCKSVALIYSSNPNPNPTPTPTPTPAPSLPDLSLAVSSAMPSFILAGSQFGVTGSVSNIGDIAASTSSLSVVLSRDNIYSTGDQSLYSSTLPSIASKGSVNFSAILTMPTTLTLNNYYIIVCSDATNAITEKDETNNCVYYAVTANVPKPDLSVAGLKLSANSVPTGSSFTVSYKHQNNGTAASGSSSVGLYLSKSNNTYEASDPLLAESSFPAGLAVGGSSDEFFKVTSKIDTGNYYLIICADNKSEVAELNESNNCSAIALTIADPIPDLTMELINAPNEFYVGKEQKITVRVKNSGLKKSTIATSSALYFSATNGIDKTSVLIGTIAVPPLDVNAFKDTTLTYTVKDELQAGPKYLAYCIDPANKVIESDENNCTALAIAVIVPLPDLASISNVNFSKSIPRNGIINFPCMLTNIGISDAPSTLTEFYLSTKPFIKNGGYRFPTDSARAIAVGDTLYKMVALSLPSSIFTGEYYLTVCADYNNKIKEPNKVNNCQSLRMTIRSQYPDLDAAELSIKESSIYGGIPFGLKLGLKNTGEIKITNAKLRIRYYGNNSADTINLADIRRDSILIGAQFDTIISVVVDKKYTGQNLVFEAVADPENSINESDETNNVELLSHQVSTPLPDITSTFLTISDSVLHTGKEYKIIELIRNAGVAPADSFNVALSLIDTTGRTLVTLNTTRRNGLAVSSSDTLSQTFKIPSAIFSGAYYIKFSADPDKLIQEIDKSNNITAHRVTIIHSLPDIDAEDILMADSLSKGSTVTVTFLIKNIGDADMPVTSGKVTLSNTDTVDKELHDMGTLSLPALASGQAIELENTIHIPEELVTGTYKIIVRLDDQNQFEELNKNNNVAEHAIVIPNNKADLDHVGIQLISGSIVKQGDEVALTHFVKNKGETVAGPFEISYSIKKHSNDTIPEYTLSDFRCLEDIQPGSLNEINSKIIIPDTITPGSYFISSCLDSKDEIDELSKANNCSEILITIEKKNLALRTGYAARPLFAKINIYPNPAHEWIEVSGTLFSSNDPINMEIKDFMGRVITREKLETPQDLHYTRDVSSLSHGTYILEMTTKKGIWKQTFVKL